MKFDLKRPCKMCPFRTDCMKGWLGEQRAEGIIESMTKQDQSFTCHETNTFDDEDGEATVTKDSQHCAGAMILMERYEFANQMMRIMERLGFYDRNKLDMDAPVFMTYEDFINHHSKV